MRHACGPRTAVQPVVTQVGALDDAFRPPCTANRSAAARPRAPARRHGPLKLHGGEPAEVKRMWVSPAMRGLGLGRRLLAELEHRAITRGASALRLETNHALTQAVALYRGAGYREVAAFNDEPYAHHWFEKPLTAPVPGSPAASGAGERREG